MDENTQEPLVPKYMMPEKFFDVPAPRKPAAQAVLEEMEKVRVTVAYWNLYQLIQDLSPQSELKGWILGHLDDLGGRLQTWGCRL